MAKKSSSQFTLDDILAKYSVKRDDTLYDSGIPILNALLGGGISFRAMYSIWGVAGSGKSSIALQVVRNLCNMGHRCCIIDTEVALNDFQAESFMLKKHIDSKQCIHITADTLEDLEQIVMRLPEGGIDFVVVDSISMLSPYVPDDLCVRDAKPGIQALQESRLLPKMKKIFYANNIGSMLIFHGAANIQTGISNPYAPVSKQKGGYSSYHAPDVRIKVVAGAKLKDSNDRICGCEVRLECEKNKFAPPFVCLNGKLIYGKGISRKMYIIDAALEQGLITKNGNVYVFPDGSKFVGLNQLYYKTTMDVVEPLYSQLSPIELLPLQNG